MAKYLQYRDGGKTDEKGISTHLGGLFSAGVIDGLGVTQNSPVGMSVLVAQGRIMIDSGDDYPYLGFTDSNSTVTITTADGSNPRIDTVVAYVDLSVVDSTNANNPDAFKLVAVAGTPAGSPSAPNAAAIQAAIGLSNPYATLANVAVAAGATTISNANITDTRSYSSVVIRDAAVTSEKLTSTIAFRAYNTTGSYSFSATPTIVNFASEVYDLGSDYDGTNKFTAPVAGVYNFSARMSREDSTLGYIALYLYVNGSAYVKGNLITGSPTKSGAIIATDIKLAANDYVQVYCEANSSASGTIGTTNALTYFTGHLVGTA